MQVEESKVIFYSTHDHWLIKTYKLIAKSRTANARFQDKITKHDLLCLILKYDRKCFYCYDKLDPKKWQLDHFYSRAMGGKNVVDNLVPACKWCNQMKSALDGHAFIHKAKKISQNNFFDKLNIN